MDSDCVINIHGHFQNFSKKKNKKKREIFLRQILGKLVIQNFRVCFKEGDSFSAPHECEIYLIQHIWEPPEILFTPSSVWCLE
jgi:hypothetical protein